MKFKESILKSHQRCLSNGLNINCKINSNCYDNIDIMLKSNRELLLSSSRIISLLYELIKNEEVVIVLTDYKGQILNVSGKDNIIEIKVGGLLDENHIGTTAFSISILEKISLLVNKNDHYLKVLQNINSYATPITLNEELIGVLGIFGNSSIDILGILVKASNIISEYYEKHKDEISLKTIISYKDNIKNESNNEYEVFSLEELEKNHIIKVLDLNNGNITISAQALGIARNTLYRKISKYNIEISITE